MKQIPLSIALIAGLALASCNNSENATVAGTNVDSTTSMEQQNLEKMRSVYKAIETGVSATIRSLIADDAVDHQGPNGEDLKGADAITHMLTNMHNHVKDLKFETISDAVSGDYIFSLVHVSGTASDNSMGMPAGNKMDDKSVDVVKIKDGKMVEHWGFMDQQQVMKMSQKPTMDNGAKK